MDQSTRKNGVSRVSKPQKVKTPPTPKPKPPKLSTAPSNKINNEPNSSSTPKQLNSNTTVIRGPNINRLSSVFEDPNITADQTIIKSRVAPSLPLSPKLPVPMVKKTYIKKSVSRDNITSDKKMNIDESSLIFGDLKAKFQANEGDGAIPTQINKFVGNRPIISSKNPDERVSTPTNLPKHANNINIKAPERSRSSVITSTIEESDVSEDSVDFDWIDIPYINQVLEMNERNSLNGSGTASQQTTLNSSTNKKSGRNSSHSAQSSKRNSIIVPSNDFEAKRASIANLLSGSSQILVRPKDLHLETSKALPPIPISPSQSPSLKVTSPLSDTDGRPKSEISLPSFSSETTLVEEDENSIDLKRRRKLWNVIKELVETERVFFNDMVLLEKVYYIQAQEVPIFNQYDCKTIFSNLAEIIDFSEQFLALLRAASGIGEDDDDPEKHYELENDDTTIGEAFAQVMEKCQGEDSRLEAVYGEYCKRHEAAVQKLQEFDSDETVQGFLQRCKSQCEGQTRSWDIASLLIKPVQRVLKYPLLLQQILSLTKPSHSDYKNLQFAFSEITKVAERINEIKRRKDIVEKIVGSKKKADADVSVFLEHGITKSFTRRGQMIKHATGIAKPTEDELYNAYVAKFRTLEQKGIQLSKDIKNWVKQVKIFFEDQQRLAAAIEDFYLFGDADNKSSDDCKRVVEYVKIIKSFSLSSGKEMEETIKKTIYPEIDKILNYFKAPAAVMKKRERKILDYDRANSIKARGATPDKSLQQSADAFVSISDQLHEELPSFFVFITEYFDIIVQEFIKIQSKFYKQMDMDFRLYFYKFIDLQALQNISDDRELVLRNIDITTEYTDYFHGSLGMEDRLIELGILNKQTFSDLTDGIGRPKNDRRSSFSESLGSSGSSKQAEDSLNQIERSPSWYSDQSLNNRIQNSFGLDDLAYENRSKNSLDDSFNFQDIKNKSQQRYSAHKKYATDGVIDHRSLEEEDDDIFHDTLTGEEDDEALFLCQTIHTNKSKEKNELNFKPGVLLKIIHIDESGEWWFAVNEDTGDRGWVDPAFVERIG
ncbi:2657_t:CDS:10 [Scutellospora calospora]|uniref:2657_t:CDS:1 n=1 Tax=Scutellospora calospora TaxID=85575 RepID=A0ACA9K807_9GLOM|nr:2657_t:CDS:10 [Scutellospora calospora]